MCRHLDREEKYLFRPPMDLADEAFRAYSTRKVVTAFV